jgi:hypothetical protein
MQTAIKKLQKAREITERVLGEPMGNNSAADNMRLVLALSLVHDTIDEVLKLLTE